MIEDRPFIPPRDLNDTCDRKDCPADGGSGEGCVECWPWWDREERRVKPAAIE